MPRKTLPAAAFTLALAAWSISPALADGGTPASGSSQANAAKTGPVKTSKLLTPFTRLKQLASKKTATGAVQQTAHKSSGQAASESNRAQTAAYEDPIAPPVDMAEDRGVKPAPGLLPAPAPAAVAPAAPMQSPAYAPVPERGGAIGFAVVPGYPNLNAPMNPTPVPHVPHQVGSTIVTNQAFYPHEMLYPHKYRAMYPPYYYKVRGHWFVTPWGVWSNDRWELQGTEVKVKYRSNYAPFSGFTPPCISEFDIHPVYPFYPQSR